MPSLRTGLLDRGVPDVMPTDDLTVALAAEIDHLAGRTSRWSVPGEAVPPGIAARALTSAGAVDDARVMVAEWTPDQVRTWGLQGVVAGLRAASRVGTPPVIAALVEQVERVDDEFLLDDGVPLGPAATHLGIGAAALGEEDRALAHLVSGVERGDERAPIWGALARLELARVLLGLPSPDVDRAAECLSAARLFFGAGGFRHLASIAERLTSPPDSVASAEPGLGHLVPGDRWIVGFGVQPPHPISAAKGLRALRHLVTHAGETVPTVHLDQVIDGGQAPEAGLRDVRTADEVRARFVDERVRSRVSKLIHRSIEKIERVHLFLGRHLATSVRTGHSCRYEPAQPVRWRC